MFCMRTHSFLTSSFACFDVTRPSSLEELMLVFHNEVFRYGEPYAIRYLIGLKSDLRTNPDHIQQMTERGEICNERGRRRCTAQI